MIVRELELTNIRSHGHSLIRFPVGKTLLEGDIGSGKSSVLMAIEFAFFGLGSDTGASVLKMGQEAGQVRMLFEVDGSEYEVTRRLQRKGNRVQQTDGYLKTPGETLNLSPSELKEKVLEVLEFNEAPDPKAQSWIYRYAVYTPQEEMKSILVLPPEQRLQILRRAFRVEDYKTAVMNAEEAVRQIREDTRELEGIAKGVEDLRREVEALQKEEAKYRPEFVNLEEETRQKESQVESLKAEREEIRKSELGLQETKAEKDYYERLQSEGNQDAQDAGKEIETLAGAIARVDAFLEEAESKAAPASRPLAELRRRERSLEARMKKLTGLKAAAESKLSDYESIMEKGVCPVCDRPVEAHDFDEKKADKDAERKHLEDELGSVESELDRLRESIKQATSLSELKKEVARRKTERSRLKADMAKKEAAKKKYAKRAAFAKGTLGQIAKKLEELKGVVEKGKAVDGKLAEVESALDKVKGGMIRAKERLESAQKQQTRIAIQIVAKEEASEKSVALKERELWLGDYFVPTVKVIERSVLATINQEFDSLFKRWFGMLVSDPDKEVGVDEDFAPFVSQGGYEQDVRYLSGGERTSVALAYRLALNVLAQRVSAGMKSNLLILDEPTDGFSKEQLGNVREVLDEVACSQVIVVSHDKELESFVDQIFQIRKAGSESMVIPPQAQGGPDPSTGEGHRV